MPHTRCIARALLVVVAGLGLAAWIPSARADDDPPDPLPRRAYLGAGVAELDSTHAAALGVGPRGVWVHALAGTSPLRDAGVRVDDVIGVLDRTPTPDVRAYAAAATALRAGEEIEIEALRRDGPHRLHVRVGEAPRERAPGLVVSYGSFEVAGGARLRTIIASPVEESEARPAVLIVQDIVDVSVEHPLAATTRDLAYALARAGYVAMRVDRRGMGDSEGESYRNASFEDELADLTRALEYLRRRAGVDPARVSAVAFGAGDVLASHLAAADGALAGLVCVGAPGRPWGEWLARSLRVELAVPTDDARARLDAIAKAATPEEILERLPSDLAGRPAGRTAAFMATLLATPAPRACAAAPCPLALVVPGADPVVDAVDARAIERERRAIGLDAPETLAVEGVDARLARAESAEASLTQRRSGLYVFGSAAAEMIIGWLDDRSMEVAERPGARR